MYKKFSDYMYYLLTSPFKRVEKAKNNWYILCTVLGDWFNECMEDVYKAREEGMLATCSDIMLPVHAADRDMNRYIGENDKSYRKRIAWYTELKRLGGTQEGVFLAVKTLGYDNPVIMRAVELLGDQSRWAEFYIILKRNIDEEETISFDILQKQVRKVKYSAAKENFLFQYFIIIKNDAEKLTLKHKSGMLFSYYDYLRLDGTWKLDGTQLLNSTIRKFKVSSNSQVELPGSWEEIKKITYVVQHNFWTLDGTYKLDGEKLLDAYKRVKIL